MSDKQVIHLREPLGFSGYLMTLSDQPAPPAKKEPATQPAVASQKDQPPKPER